MTDSTADNTVRLAKRVSEMRPCSRREAELYIEGGWVSVDGVVIEEAGARVTEQQRIDIAADATLLEIVPMTILLHKPAGFNAGIGGEGAPALSILSAESHNAQSRGPRFLKRHLSGLTLTNPLATMASGLLIYTQDFRVSRKLVDRSEEHTSELIVE